jgi:beta-glucanase (GH16 family)
MKKRDNLITSIHYCMVLCILLTTINAVSQTNITQLVWSDEFNYTGAPDTNKWGYDIGGNGWGNQELQYYTDRPENIIVQDGKMIITALIEDYEGKSYTSARLTTRTKGDWLYGRIEVMAKLPAGRGTWPAIWMLPTDWEYGGWPASGEIDIMEHVGYDMGTVHATVHTETYNGAIGTQKGDDIYIPDVHTTFHLYVMEWSEDTIHFYADSVRYFSFPNYHTGYEEWPFDKQFHLMLNIAIGGTWGGQQGVDNTIFPQTLEIDYVRVYRMFQKQTIHGPDEVYAMQEDITYTINEFEGASYTWSFPEGVTIISGQGSASVTVNWGDNPGIISVLQSYDDVSYTSTLFINLMMQPGDGSLIIKGNEDEIGTWSVEPGEGNSIEMDYEE